MPIHTSQVQVHRFTGLDDLDDVLMYIEHMGQACRFTFACYANSWTAHFQNLDTNESPIDRLLNLSTEDVVRALQWGTPEIINRERAKETIYLRHIVAAVKREIEAFMELQSK